MYKLSVSRFKFLFKTTLLRFNGPTSTTVSHAAAAVFAKDAGLVLEVKPHWTQYRGNVRAFECSSYSAYPDEQEFLFNGGLEPLIIRDIIEVQSIKSYSKQVQSINNIHQILGGMNCGCHIRPNMITSFIQNRLLPQGDAKRETTYMHSIFDYYCDELQRVTIRLSLMSQSYKNVADCFMDSYRAGTLKLKKIVRMFPLLERVTVSDGFDHQLVPQDTDYGFTILGVVEESICYVQDASHPLESIRLEAHNKIDAEFVKKFRENLEVIAKGWQCKAPLKGGDDNWIYVIQKS